MNVESINTDSLNWIGLKTGLKNVEKVLNHIQERKHDIISEQNLTSTRNAGKL